MEGENYYSSPKCTENKWFDLAEKVGEWHILIIQKIRFTPVMKEIYVQRVQVMKRRYFGQKWP